MSLSDEVAEEQTAKVRQERDRLRSELQQATERNVELARLLNLLEAGQPKPPKWLQPKKTKGPHRATVCGILIGGIWPPIMRMIARKGQRYSDTPFDVVIMGHWHQLILAPTQGLIVNGSTKGYDEYAALSNFRPEPPQQAIWLVTPERGVTWSGPIFCGDRAAEGW